MTATPAPEDLFRRYRDHGDPAALAGVFDALAPRLLLLAAHVTPDPAAAEDLLQETFLQAMAKAAQWDPQRPLLPWLGVILRHRAVDLARRLKLRRPTDADLDGFAGASGIAGPADEAATRELLERIDSALAGMSSPYREALVLRLVHGMEPTAIAHALGRPPETVRTQLRRGLELLRGALPASLASALALVLAERGMAATRASVLAAAKAGARTSRHLGWWLLGAATLALGIAGWFALPRQPAAVPPQTAVAATERTPRDPAAERPVEPTPAPDAARIPGSLPATDADVRTSTLRGRLVRQDDRSPIAGGRAEVSFGRGRFVTDDPDFRTYPDPVETRASADGTFAITFTPAELTRVFLALAAPGFATVDTEWVSVKNGIDVDLGDIPLPRAVTLRARAVDEQGAPVPGLTLNVERHSGGMTGPTSMFTMWSSVDLTSAGDGALEPQELPAPATYGVAISFRQPGWRVVRPGELVADVADLVTDIVVARAPITDRILGRVVDEHDNPVAGVTITADAEMLDLGSAVSGADGSFWLAPDVKGDELPLYLPVTERRFALLEPERHYARGTTEHVVRVRRMPTFDVPIDVVDARDGSAVTGYGVRWCLDYWGADMELQMPPDAIYRPAPVEPHAAGRTVVPGLAPGNYRLCVHPANHDLATAYLVPFKIGADGPRAVRVELQPFAPLRVVLRDDRGEPLPGVAVQLIHTMGAGQQMSAVFTKEQFARGVGGGLRTAIGLETVVTNGDGVAILPAPTGEDRLALRLNGPRVHSQQRELAVVPANGRDEPITLPTLAIVRGRLVPPTLLDLIGPSAEQRREAAIVRDEDSELGYSMPTIAIGNDRTSQNTRVADDGTFEFATVEAGDHTISMSLQWRRDSGFYARDDHELAAVTGLRPGETRDLGAIDVSRLVPARVHGRVTLDGATWTAGQLVLVNAAAPDETFAIDLDERAQFTLVQRPGRYLPCLEWEDAAGRHLLAAEQLLELGVAAEVDCALPFVHRVLRLAVVDANGAPVPGQTLRIVPIDRRELGERFARSQADAAGMIVLDPAPPGRVQVFLPGSGGAPLAEIVATPGSRTEAKVVVPVVPR